MKLSIVIPFFNSYYKCDRMLASLSDIFCENIEIIFVDDGSSDDTFLKLVNFIEKNSHLNIILIQRKNGGPGAARNSGLDVLQGNYCWFVDSDDAIEPKVINEILELLNDEYDFIDFSYVSAGILQSSMSFNQGFHVVNSENIYRLIDNFGRICTKIFNVDFLKNNKIKYPENCIYEDNFLGFTLPFVVKKFYVSNKLAYLHFEDYESVTRGGINLRYFDRLYTAALGINSSNFSNGKEFFLLNKKFNSIFLANTIHYLFYKKEWKYIPRVFKFYNQCIDDFNKKNSSFKLEKKIEIIIENKWKELIFKTVAIGFVYFSLILPSQKEYFAKIRMAAWPSLEMKED